MHITEDDYRRAEENGIKKHTFYQRVYIYGWDIEKSINTPLKTKHNYYSKLTEQQKELMVKNNIDKNCFLIRVVKLKWSIEDAITIPPAKTRARRKNPPPERKVGKIPKALREEALKNGITAVDLHNRLRRGWTLEEALTRSKIQRGKKGIKNESN